jgi:hypothetical protein
MQLPTLANSLELVFPFDGFRNIVVVDQDLDRVFFVEN